MIEAKGPPVSSTIWLVLTVVLASVVVGRTVGYAHGESAGAAPAWSVNLAVALILVAHSCGSMIHRMRSSENVDSTGTLVVASLNILTVTLPGATLVWRTRTATVERLLGLELASSEALATVIWAFTGAMIAFAVGERLATLVKTKKRLPQKVPGSRTRSAARISLVLTAVGLVTHAANLSRGIGAGFDTRGEAEGQGLLSMAGWSLPLGIALAVLNRHWGSRFRVGLTAIGVIAIVLSGVRSPLLLVVVATLPRAVMWLARSRFPLPVALAAVVLGNSVIAVGAGISSWRGEIRAGRTVSLWNEITDAWVDPVAALGTTGVDTIDGALFVDRLPADAVQVSPFDPLKAFLILIPRQIYPDKPDLISNILSQEYLNFGTAGMFLSGVGYLTLVFGSLGAALVAFAVLGAAYGLVLSGRIPGVLWLIATYVVVRFWMGGDAFDIFIGLELGLIYAAGFTINRVLAVAVSGRSPSLPPAAPVQESFERLLANTTNQNPARP